MAYRKLTLNAVWEVADHAHNCKQNKAHRIEKGHPRLSVRLGGMVSHKNYCVECGLTMLKNGIIDLNALISGTPKSENLRSITSELHTPKRELPA